MASFNSRIIVKNLPKSVNEIKIRSLFGEKGTVTDVQLKYKSDGQFRGFAFIGFKTPEEAETARNYFDKSFIGTSKIQVEACAGLGDPTKPKAWSKHALEHQDSFNKLKRKQAEDAKDGEADEDEEEHKPKKKMKEEEILDKCKADPEFLEFLQSHRKKSAWGNDEVIDELEKQVQMQNTDGVEKSDKKSKKKKSAWDNDEVFIELDKPDQIQTTETAKKYDKDSKKKSKKKKNLDQDEEQKPKKQKKKKDKDPSLKKAKSPKLEKTFFTIKLQEVPTKAKKRDIKAFFAPLIPKTVRIPRKFLGIAYVGFRTEEERVKALHKHKSFLLGNKIFLKTINLPNLSTFQANETKLRNSRWTEQQRELENESEPVLESGRIYVRNLSYLTNEDEIRSLFEPYGPVTEVHLPLDRLTRRIKGFGFVTFMLPEHAVTAFSNLDGTVFQGRMLHLLPAKNKAEQSEDSTGGSSYKNAKALKQKKTASSTHNWNTLFLGQNAVADVAADKYGLSKEELLLDQSEYKDKKQTSVAVRMALAEAEIVDETRKFLESNGVSLAAFENVKTDRSKTCMLVKNLQGNTTADELIELFAKHGEVGRIILPKSGVTAIVEFLEPAEARAAFKKLAYSKFGGMPLYLEWAPVDTFATVTAKAKGTLSTSTFTSATVIEEIKNLSETEKLEETKVQKVVGTEEKTGSKLLVRNVPFEASKEEMLDLFKTFGEVKSCRLPLKADGSGEHRGFAFIEFFAEHEAKRAMETLAKSTHLYGRRLVIEWAFKTETVEELRQKTALQFSRQTSGRNSNTTGSTKNMMTRYFSTLPKKKSDDEEEDE